MTTDLRPPPPSRLPSDTSKPFVPGTKNDLVKVNGHYPKERARIYTGAWNQWQIDRNGIFDITTGADTVKYWRLASTHRDVWSALRLSTMGSFWIQPELQANNDYERYPSFEAIDKKIMKFLQDVFTDMLFQSLEASEQDNMDWAKTCGFGVAEPVWQVIDGHWVIRALKTYPSYDFTPIIDEYHNLNEIYHYPTGMCYDPGAFIWATWPRIVGGSYLGLSEIRPIRADLLLVERLEESRVKNGSALSRLPLVIGYNAAMGEAEIANLRAGVDAAFSGKGGGLVYVPGRMDEKGQFQPHATFTLPGNRASIEAMRALDTAIAESLRGIKRSLGMLDDMGATTISGGNRAKAESQFNLSVARWEEGARWRYDVRNRQMIRPLIEFNYPNLPAPYRYPTISAPELQEEFSESKAKFVQTLFATGALTTDRDDIAWARNFLGLPPLPEGALMQYAAPTDATAAAEVDVQGRFANGAQVTAAIELAIAVKAGRLAKGQARAILESLYDLTPIESERITSAVDL